MKFLRQSTRHTKLNRCPASYLKFSLPSVHIIPGSPNNFFPAVPCPSFNFPSTPEAQSKNINIPKSRRAFTPEYIQSARFETPHFRLIHHRPTTRLFLGGCSRVTRVRASAERTPVERFSFRAREGERERAARVSHLGAARADGAQTFHWVNVVVPPFWLHFRYRPTTRSHYRHSGGGSGARDGEGWTNDNGEWLPEQAEWDGRTLRGR